jgi:hypothetical protein
VKFICNPDADHRTQPVIRSIHMMERGPGGESPESEYQQDELLTPVSQLT